jgi:hypothetical protein
MSQASSTHSVSYISNCDIAFEEAEHSSQNESIHNAPLLDSVYEETSHLENESTLNERLPVTDSSKDDNSPRQNFMKSSLRPFAILTDCAAIIAPMAIICLLIAVRNLNNRAVRSIALNTWLNTLTVVCFQCHSFAFLFELMDI